MHEYPITLRIVQMAEEHCVDNGGERVTAVNLVLGEYSGYVPESIDMYFDVISEGTLCEDAKINIKRVEAKLKCPECGELFKKPHMSFACPRCGADGGPTEIGKEFYVDSIEIE
jgi:hydrogenase nickel incorporation protein HypA/HybF